MKRAQIHTLATVLAGKKLGAVKDDSQRRNLIRFYMALAAEDRKSQEHDRELRRIHFEGKEKAVEDHDALVGLIRATADPDRRAELSARIDPAVVEAIRNYRNDLDAYLGEEAGIAPKEEISEDTMMDLDLSFEEMALLSDTFNIEE